MTATSCPNCGAEHDPGASPCREPMVGRTLRAGIRVRELLGDTPVGPHYRAEYPTGLEVAVLILGSSAELALRWPSLQPAIQIQHPNVAAIHDLNETHDGLVYAVAERLTGEFLSVTLARRGALPLEEALDLCLQAAAGLRAAHDLGWVHGSLSPYTILLAQTVGGRPLVKLIGFAHEFPLRQSEAESPIEGGVYASPERIAGHPPDERSDVFSLGAVLHHLLTGAPPTPGSRGGRVPKAMRAVLNRALAPSPARRFQTIAEFAAALAPSHEEVFPILAPCGPARPAWRRALAFGAAAALVGVVAGLWLPWGTQRPSVGASARARSQERGSIAAVEPDSSSALARLPADSGPVAVGRHHSAAAQIPTDSVLHTPTSRASHDSAPAVAESLLVDVQSVDSTIQVDLRYATANNFTGAPLPGYEAPRALLHREVATALSRVQARLRPGGLGLSIFDAYRPVRATLAMVDWAKRTGHRELLESGFIGRRSRHNLGVAVDVTLVDLVTGTAVPMGTAFDSSTTAGHTANTTGRALRYQEILVRTMESEGFSTHDQAWWHFVYALKGAVPLDRVIR
ncbi:MAG: M15 family metallopeptidase [Gemmatimonadales bacterium]